ncbi:hypothetical protein EMCRGX_G029222 [Ephydatia muelleri]
MIPICAREINTATAEINLQVLQPPKKAAATVHERYDYCISEKPSTCNDFFASDDSTASAEEYVGFLGKEYAAKDQEKRLTIDLPKLKNDAASVTNPSLLEQSCEVENPRHPFELLGVQLEAGSSLGHEAQQAHPADILIPNWKLGKPAAIDLSILSSSVYDARFSSNAGRKEKAPQ